MRDRWHPERAAATLERLAPIAEALQILTWAGRMGADAVHRAALVPTIVGSAPPAGSTAEDTRSAALEMVRRGVELLLFAGGDGTARDLCDAVGSDQPVLGIPAGVKMHSAVFGIDPGRAGDLALDYLTGKTRSLRNGEVMDLDEAAARNDQVRARLYGYLSVPFCPGRIQSLKTPSADTERSIQAQIAMRTVRDMDERSVYLIGPGTTTQAVLTALNLSGTLLGVDVVCRRRLICKDAGASDLVRLTGPGRVKIVVTPIGGQGILLGRGNQQISPEVLDRVAFPRDLIVVATPDKIHSMGGKPLCVDTGDPSVDRRFRGYVRITTGGQDRIVYRVA